MAGRIPTRLDASWRRGNTAALLVACLIAAAMLALLNLPGRYRLSASLDVEWNKVASVRQKVDPNADPPASIRRLRTIGPARTKAIVDYRRSHGPRAFASADDLIKVPGIGPITVQQIQDQIEIRE
jgi:competence ComEA-like helix-hairpin-helix protein